MTSCIYDDKSQKLLDELFALLEQIAPESPNGVRTLWLRAERGPIEDFGNAAEEIAEGNYDSEEEFVNAWKSWFPEDVKWYHFQAVEDKAEGYRAVAVRHSYVIVQDKRREPAGWPCEISEFVQWLVDGVRSCIEMLKAGTYNDVVRENLPPQHRTGTIRRRDFWNVWPDARVDFFKDISPADVTEFIERASAQEENYAAMKDRLQAMTANNFFRFCAMGYAENKYDGCGKTPKEQYVLHADGRDEGLQDIDADSPEAFHAWFHDRDRCGGHPWEVCRGGNSTHVDLRVMEDARGYFLYLAGAAWNRTRTGCCSRPRPGRTLIPRALRSGWPQFPNAARSARSIPTRCGTRWRRGWWKTRCRSTSCREFWDIRRSKQRANIFTKTKISSARPSA